MIFYMYLFMSVIVVDCIFSINLFLKKKKIKKKKKKVRKKKLQIIQNIKNLICHIIFFWLNFNKANHSFLHPFLLFGKKIFETMLPGEISNFLLPRVW